MTHPVGDSSSGERSRGFWRSLPGVLTAVAAIVTAVGGLIAIMLQLGFINGTQKSPASGVQPVHTAVDTTDPAVTARRTTAAPTTTAPPNGKPWSEATVEITDRNGKVTRGRADLMGYCINKGALHLDESQNVPWEKIASVVVIKSDPALATGGRATVKVTLVTGTVVDGTVSSGCEFILIESELGGRYTLFSDRLAKVEIIR